MAINQDAVLKQADNLCLTQVYGFVRHTLLTRIGLHIPIYVLLVLGTVYHPSAPHHETVSLERIMLHGK